MPSSVPLALTILGVSMLAIFVFAAGAEYILGKKLFTLWTRHRDEQRVFRELKDNLLNIGNLLGRPDISLPIYFFYIDRQRVEDLYGQIEPAWKEVSRESEASSSAGATAGAAAGSAKVELGGKTQRSERTVSHATPPSLERQCLELMRFAVEKKNAKLYRTGRDWFLLRLASIPMQEAARIEKQTGVDAFAALSTVTEEQRKEINRRLNLWDTELESELTNLKGLVFVEGSFVREEFLAAERVLTHTFVDESGRIGDVEKRFRRVRFRVSMPETGWAKVPSQRNSKLRVFGFVLSPLDREGLIDVRALAVY